MAYYLLSYGVNSKLLGIFTFRKITPHLRVNNNIIYYHKKTNETFWNIYLQVRHDEIFKNTIWQPARKTNRRKPKIIIWTAFMYILNSTDIFADSNFNDKLKARSTSFTYLFFFLDGDSKCGRSRIHRC